VIHTIETEEDRTPAERRTRSKKLTPREAQALVWAARGLTAEQTSTRMGISTLTVKDTRRSAINRMDSVCLTQALAVALKRGDLTIDQL